MSSLVVRKHQPIQTVGYLDIETGILHEHLNIKRTLLRLSRRILTWRVISVLAVSFTASFLLWKTANIIGEVIAPIQQSLAAPIPNINDISISNFQTQFHPQVAKVFLTLTTNGKTTKYPNLLIQWVDSGIEIIRVTPDEYPHPAGAFSGSFDLDFQIYKPVKSGVMNISIQYD